MFLKSRISHERLVIIIAPSKSERDRFLNSVIKALDKNEALRNSAAMAHALVLRAASVEDLQRASLLDPLHPTVWRALSDLEEANGNVRGAMQALQQWAKHQPKLSTKIGRELDRLATASAASA